MPIPNKNTRAVFDALKQCARDMHTINYQALAAKANIPWSRKAMSHHLGHIRDAICTKRGLPPLNQLAVRKQTWRPGDSVLPSKFKVPADAEEHLWRGMVLQVFAFPWDTVEFDRP